MYGCTSKTLYNDVSDIMGKNIGILKNDVGEEEAKKLFSQVSVTEYDKTISLFLDMESNRCDAALMTEEAVSNEP